MEFFRFLMRESPEFDRRLFVLGGFVGVVNTLMIFLLTAAGTQAMQRRPGLLFLALIVLCLAAFWVGKGHLLQQTTVIVEDIVKRIRQRIGEKIRQADLPSFEMMGRAPLYNAISTHTASITKAAGSVISAGTSLVVLVCAFLVIFLLSSAAFLILAAALAAIFGTFYLARTRTMESMREVTREDNRYVQAFSDLLDGFKELKMSFPKSAEFFEGHLHPMTEAARALRVKTNTLINKSILLATSALFIMLAAVVFLVPVLAPSDTQMIPRIATLIVFVFGPLGEIVAVYPHFAEALAAIEEIQRVEKQLDSLFEAGGAEEIPMGVAPVTFQALRCHDLSFSYHNEKGDKSFSLEPFHFELNRGELVFITGGNGSGKSTFLKVLAGLYPPASGRITLNDTVIERQNRQLYRDLFAVIFSDFHLFVRLYGIQEFDPARLNHLLETMDLAHKTRIVDREISTLSLSTGQRKRLALALALLENKPIYLFDEWAAEQDPAFRRKFYREILPSLKNDGKTIVAVTHDDDFYHVADRVLKMDYGKFLDERRPAGS